MNDREKKEMRTVIFLLIFAIFGAGFSIFHVIEDKNWLSLMVMIVGGIWIALVILGTGVQYYQEKHEEWAKRKMEQK